MANSSRNGTTWTAHVSDASRVGSDPLARPSHVPAAPPRRRRRWWMALIGIVLAVPGLVVLLAGLVLAVNGVILVLDVDGARSDAIVEVAVPGAATVELDSRTYVAFALGDGLVTSHLDPVRNVTVAVRADFAEPVITVVGPDGVALTVSTPSVDTLEVHPGSDVASVALFRVTTPGDHRIDVVPASPGGGVPVDSVIVREDGIWEGGQIDDEVFVVLGVILLLVGGFALTLGVVLLVIGLARRSSGSTIR
jgi:hypothetical protein